MLLPSDPGRINLADGPLAGAGPIIRLISPTISLSGELVTESRLRRTKRSGGLGTGLGLGGLLPDNDGWILGDRPPQSHVRRPSPPAEGKSRAVSLGSGGKGYRLVPDAQARHSGSNRGSSASGGVHTEPGGQTNAELSVPEATERASTT